MTSDIEGRQSAPQSLHDRPQHAENDMCTETSAGVRVEVPAGTVVLAATPIGNVGDASARLVALLERADIVAAEDTRRLYDLANRLGVHVSGKVVAYLDHNERKRANK